MKKLLALIIIIAGGFAGVKLMTPVEPPPPPAPVDESAKLARAKNLVHAAKYYERLAANPGTRPSPADRQKMYEALKKAAEARAEAAALGYTEPH